MNTKELAALLNNREYREEITRDEEAQAKSQPAITDGDAIAKEPVAEVKQVEVTKPETQYFYGKEPTVSELVNAVAVAYKVDEMQAHKWLYMADFMNYVPEKKAA